MSRGSDCTEMCAFACAAFQHVRTRISRIVVDRLTVSGRRKLSVERLQRGCSDSTLSRVWRQPEARSSRNAINISAVRESEVFLHGFVE